MTVKVDNGMANLQGYMMTLDTDHNGRYYPVVVPDAHPQYPRIDRLVIRADMKDLRTAKPVISTGAAAVSPVPPPLQRDANIWELSLAQIRVNAGATAITAGNITDERFNTELCGLINSVLGLDPSVWQGQFDAFMAGLRADSFESLEQLLTDYKNTWKSWFATIQLDPQRYIQFDYDNLTSLAGVIRKTNFVSDNEINETIVIGGNNTPVATRQTFFNADGSIKTTETLFEENGIGIMYKRTILTVFNADGSITETVDGT